MLCQNSQEDGKPFMYISWSMKINRKIGSEHFCGKKRVPGPTNGNHEVLKIKMLNKYSKNN